jgi:hypothetical protein
VGKSGGEKVHVKRHSTTTKGTLVSRYILG